MLLSLGKAAAGETSRAGGQEGLLVFRNGVFGGPATGEPVKSQETRATPLPAQLSFLRVAFLQVA